MDDKIWELRECLGVVDGKVHLTISMNAHSFIDLKLLESVVMGYPKPLWLPIKFSAKHLISQCFVLLFKDLFEINRNQGALPSLDGIDMASTTRI